MTDYWWAYSIIGAVAGLLAGVFGIGGGMVIVPALAFVFGLDHFPPQHLMHMALATSMATIVLTSISSSYSHHRRGNVRWDILKPLVPGLLLGTLLGALSTRFVNTLVLTVFFVVFVYYAGGLMLFAKPPQASAQIPGRRGMFGVGAFIGAISSWIAIGGATLATPFMVRRNVPVHQAIGTSAAIGFPVAVAGTVGYIVAGWDQTLPAHSLGFVYTPAWLQLGIITTVMAPVGVWLGQKVPAKALRKMFAWLLIIIATQMLFRLI